MERFTVGDKVIRIPANFPKKKQLLEALEAYKEKMERLERENIGKYVFIKDREVVAVGDSERETLSKVGNVQDGVLLKIGELSSGTLPSKLRHR
jgi:hypothetical protein